MKILDLHCHPIVKTLFKEQADAISAWKVITPEMTYKFNGLESQSCLEQISISGTNLVCMTRHPLEMGIVDQVLLRIATKFFKEFMDRSRLVKMGIGKYDYDEVLSNEWINLNKYPDGPHPKKIHVLANLNEYKTDDLDTIYLIFNLEGGHIFYGKENCTADVDADSIHKKYECLLEKSKMIFYLSPAHLTPNIFINHAYGNKILAKKHFFPASFGIQPIGFTLLDITYGKNILIDVKHMSLISRKQFYKFHRDVYPDKPIIASHVGLTGHSWEELYKRIYYKKIAERSKVVKIYQRKTKAVPVRMVLIELITFCRFLVVSVNYLLNLRIQSKK